MGNVINQKSVPTVLPEERGNAVDGEGILSGESGT